MRNYFVQEAALKLAMNPALCLCKWYQPFRNSSVRKFELWAHLKTIFEQLGYSWQSWNLESGNKIFYIRCFRCIYFSLIRTLKNYFLSELGVIYFKNVESENSSSLNNFASLVERKVTKISQRNLIFHGPVFPLFFLGTNQNLTKLGIGICWHIVLGVHSN